MTTASFGLTASPPKGKAGDWEGVIDILKEEHSYMLSLLETLENKAERLEQGKIPDFMIMRDMIDYLLRFPDEYHHPREDLIYAGLRRNEAGFRNLYDRLQNEHRALHDRNNALFKALTRICAGRPADKVMLKRMIKDYVKVYRQHIRFETREIFPKAKVSLSSAQLKRIEEQTRYRNDPLFSSRVLKRYRRLERIMMARLDDLEERIVSQQFSILGTTVEFLSDSLESIYRRPLLSRLPKPHRLLSGPSWQVKLTNFTARTFMKPITRFGTIGTMRGAAALFNSQAEGRLPKDVSCKETTEENFEGEWVHIANQRPAKVLLYLPGGGFVLRTPAQHRSFVADICRLANCKAFIVNYRLAPETPFPGGLEDCLAAYHALLSKGIEPENITIAGDSAGGGLTLSTLLAIRDEGVPMPAGAIILSPLADLTFSGESRKFNKYRDPMIPNDRSSSMHQLYFGDALPEDRYLSPVLADFDGMPPILGQVGSTEVLLDDTVRAADRAKEAETPFYLEVWQDMPHVFPLYSFLPESQIAKERMAAFIKTGKVDALPARYGRNTGRREKSKARSRKTLFC